MTRGTVHDNSTTPLRRVRRVTLYVAVIALSLVMIIPLLWMLSTSLKGDQYVLRMPPQFVPSPATLSSYKQLVDLLPIGRMFLNSLFVALATTVGQLLTGSMAAYAFSRMRFKGSGILFLIYLGTLMIPFQVTITPLFILMRVFGWINTYQAIILPGVFTAFGTFLLRQFFMTIPRELEDAAFIDGANHWTIFWRIILPLSKPALATLGVFAFMASWNAYLWPLFVLNNTTMMTLPVGLASLHGRYLTRWNLVMAGSVITIIPMLVVYLLAQKHFVRGVAMTGLKQ
jgi:multiple sugar transport system permease protein